ncbi:MAG: helix-turn-helix domain-containing protein [Acidimicrobiia bacterium]
MHDRADSWGAAVRNRRRQLGLRQDQVAALAGISVRSVHAVESSKPSVRLDVVLAVTEALGLELTLDGPSTRTTVRPAPR